DRHRHAAAADEAERLGHHHRVAVVEAGAAVSLGLGQAQQAEVAELLEHLVRRELLGLLPLVDVRVDLVLDHALQRAPDLFVLMRELHSVLPNRGQTTFFAGAKTWSVPVYGLATPNWTGR